MIKDKGRYLDYDRAMIDWTLGDRFSETDTEGIAYVESLKI